MRPVQRWIRLLALTTVVAVTVACGGQPAEQPAEEPVPEEEPAPVAEVAPPVEPEPEPVEPAEPVQVLQGNIVGVSDNFEWLSAATRENPGRYRWSVTVRNDTTQTLDITIRFEFLDENEAVIKTDNQTVRVAPAENGTAVFEGEMVRDAARRVATYSYTWDWRIVEDDR